MKFIHEVARRLTQRYGKSVPVVRITGKTVNDNTGDILTTTESTHVNAIILEAADYFKDYYGGLFSQKTEDVESHIRTVDRVLITDARNWFFQINDYIILEARYLITDLERYEGCTIAMLKATPNANINISINEHIQSYLLGVESC